MIGLGNTMMLQYTGDVMNAEECHRLGIINKITPHDELM
jgi:enoyl-CoA hydratase/carnithine racemase